MLPDGFDWVPRWQHADGELALKLDGKTVAMLLRRANGDWFARLECHWPITEPLVLRDCSNFEAGKAGVEAWAARHVERLRAEITRGGRSHLPDRGVGLD